jgi:hypothetical protein
LLLAVEDGTISPDEANGLLEQMVRKARYRSPVADLRSLLS